MWWSRPGTSPLRRLRQDDQELEAILDFVEKPYKRKNKTTAKDEQEERKIAVA